MTAVGSKRDRVVAAADELAYRQGFHRTRLADVAAGSGMLPGNVYYYFKTKDALGHAVVERRLESYRRQRVGWNALPDPTDRLVAFIRSVAAQRDSLAERGCPIGTLTAELGKQGGELAEAAACQFGEFLDWLEAQFRALGRGRAAREDAVSLLAGLQGAAVLANAFGDPSYVSGEARRLVRRVRSL